MGLVVAALAFYLHDSSALLFTDELVLERVGQGWRAHSGSPVLIAGKRPFLPNPLAPHRPLLRVSLSRLLGEALPARNDPAHFLNALAPFKLLSACLLLLFFPGLPLVLYRFGAGGAELLGWLAAVYLAVACIVYTVTCRRRVLELSPRECAGLAFECICCPPFAINIVRRLALRADVVTLEGHAAIFDAPSRQSLLVTASERIDEMLHGWEAGTPQAQALLQYREKLVTGCRTP